MPVPVEILVNASLDEELPLGINSVYIDNNTIKNDESLTRQITTSAGRSNGFWEDRMEHNVVTLKGMILCTKCGRTSGFTGTCSGTHEITDFAGKVMCKKCGFTTGFDTTPCQGRHDITLIAGKITCRKCGRTGLQAVFSKNNCNQNHSIAMVNGVPVCRRCGATKNWENLRCR